MKFLASLKNLQISSAILSAVGLLAALYLWWSKITQTDILCTPGSECDLVNASPYASLLGVPVVAIGAAGYAALLIAAVWAWVARADAPAWLGNARLAMASVGLFFAAYLTGIEAFILHAY